MKEITLLTDEKKVFELEADFWNRGNNLIQRALGNTFRIIAKFFGTRIHGKLIITNLRALEVKETIQWYCIPTKREVKLLTKNSIKEIGYEMDKSLFSFLSNLLFYIMRSHTQSTTIAVQNGSDEQMLDLLAKFYNVIE
ncbi:hypothetical protein LEP1GSC043_0426 [Leptospira weilii str. Ecochallenge]|uniref:Uncharacterized protein n=1 Tax=Leptospira weilii str. Ecochallenge TaxID=1049986 RepID=N1TUQ2_9LEPT|nr:hypothetical protein LEP1GSC043_0426 [Leptospira weilii str. Ecochallenge]